MEIGINGYEESKDKEALFVMLLFQQTALAHELFCNITNIHLQILVYIPYFIFLTLPFNASINKGAANTIFNGFGMMWPGF